MPISLLFTQDPQLPIGRSITRHIQAPTLIKRQPSRSEAPRAETGTITRALGYVGIPEDIVRTSGTRDRGHWLILTIGALRERNLHQLEARSRRAVPTAVVRNIQVGVVRIELEINGRGVREEGQSGLDGLRIAGIVVHGGGWGLHEPVSDRELLVCEVAGLPDGEARRVAVPLVVGLGDVADEVQFLARVVLMDVFAVALEIVAAVLDAPEPVTVSGILGGRMG